MFDPEIYEQAIQGKNHVSVDAELYMYFGRCDTHGGAKLDASHMPAAAQEIIDAYWQLYDKAHPVQPQAAEHVATTGGQKPGSAFPPDYLKTQSLLASRLLGGSLGAQLGLVNYVRLAEERSGPMEVEEKARLLGYGSHSARLADIDARLQTVLKDIQPDDQAVLRNFLERRERIDITDPSLPALPLDQLPHAAQRAVETYTNLEWAAARSRMQEQTVERWRKLGDRLSEAAPFDYGSVLATQQAGRALRPDFAKLKTPFLGSTFPHYSSALGVSFAMMPYINAKEATQGAMHPDHNAALMGYPTSIERREDFEVLLSKVTKGLEPDDLKTLRNYLERREGLEVSDPALPELKHNELSPSVRAAVGSYERVAIIKLISDASKIFPTKGTHTAEPGKLLKSGEELPALKPELGS